MESVHPSQMNILWNLMLIPIIHFIAMQMHHININNG